MLQRMRVACGVRSVVSKRVGDCDNKVVIASPASGNPAPIRKYLNCKFLLKLVKLIATCRVVQINTKCSVIK